MRTMAAKRNELVRRLSAASDCREIGLALEESLGPEVRGRRLLAIDQLDQLRIRLRLGERVLPHTYAETAAEAWKLGHDLVDGWGCVLLPAVPFALPGLLVFRLKYRQCIKDRDQS